MARAGLWSALAFVLNLVWEIAQVRLYSIWAAADGLSIAWALIHCSVGDVLIALAAWFGKTRLIDNLVVNINAKK